MNAPIRDALYCSSRKPMRRHVVSRGPRALLSLSHAQKRSDLWGRDCMCTWKTRPANPMRVFGTVNWYSTLISSAWSLFSCQTTTWNDHVKILCWIPANHSQLSILFDFFIPVKWSFIYIAQPQRDSSDYINANFKLPPSLLQPAEWKRLWEESFIS